MSIPPLYRKCLVLSLLTLLLLWPQAWIEALVDERDARHRAATEQILEEWGESLEIRGPLLRVPTKTNGGVPSTSRESSPVWQVAGATHAVPRDLKVTGQVDVESRSRGIFTAQVYQGVLTLSGTVDVPAAADGKTLDWDGAAFVVFYSHKSGASGPAVLEMNGVKTPMSMAFFADLGSVHVGAKPVLTGSSPLPGSSLEFSITLPFKGVRRFQLTPLALNTTVEIASNWPSPGFSGGWLPAKRAVDDRGFRAKYIRTASLADFDALGQDTATPMTSMIDGFVVSLLDDVSHYLQVTRAVKYAALFVVLTFVAFFLFETFGGLKLHPIQYTAVGAAQIVFYLLLLSFSERVSFVVAYWIATAAVVAVITGYSSSILARRSRSYVIGIGLSGLYGFMYTLLQLEQQSLIVGSIGVFLGLAAFMYATRKVDWYQAVSPKSDAVGS